MLSTNPITADDAIPYEAVRPRCPVFGKCGGCAYQDRLYRDELILKEERLQAYLNDHCGIHRDLFKAIVPSPAEYQSRSRLDLSLKKNKAGDISLGFMPREGKSLVSVTECPIAREEISAFIPELKRRAEEKLPPDYRTANLVVKTDDTGRMLWGGIGRHSLRLEPKDYLWTEIEGRRVFYSLETFFQANLSILPALIREVRELSRMDRETIFLDLYAGVGLFGIVFAPEVKKTVMIEECPGSVQLARYNAAWHGDLTAEVLEGKVERALPFVLAREPERKMTAVIDPPRQGLSEAALECLAGAKSLSALLYLSCYPESLARDLQGFLGKGWRVMRVVPFDFFPKTHHIETLVLLRPE